MSGTTTQAPTVSGTTSIRNVVLVGPSGSGKSRLFDHVVDAVVPGRAARGQTEPTTGLRAATLVDRVGGGHPPRRPGQPRLRRGRASRAEGGGCRPLRGLGGRRCRRAEPCAVARVRHRRDAARGRHHPARRPRRRLRGDPGRLPGALRHRHPAARGAGAGRRRCGQLDRRPAARRGARLRRRHAHRAPGRPRARRALRHLPARAHRGDHRGVRGRRPDGPLPRGRGARLRDPREGPAHRGRARHLPPGAAAVGRDRRRGRGAAAPGRGRLPAPRAAPAADRHPRGWRRRRRGRGRPRRPARRRGRAHRVRRLRGPPLARAGVLRHAAPRPAGARVGPPRAARRADRRGPRGPRRRRAPRRHRRPARRRPAAQDRGDRR